MNDTGNAQDPASTLSDSPPVSSPDEVRTLRREDEGRMLTGVCAGLGRYAGIDPVLFRVGFAVLVLGSGIGIMLYVAAFLLMRETNGGPGYMEQWTRRDFDGETVLALLTGIFALGLIINVSSDGIGTGTVVVGTLFAIALLTAHARGVDLLALSRSLPDRLRGRTSRPSRRPPMPFAPPPGPAAPAPPTFASAAPAPGAAPASTSATAPVSGTVSGTVPGGPSGTVAGPSGQDRPDTPRAGRAAEAAGAPQTGSAPSGHHSTGVSFDSSGEPFSPYGPYRPLDPYRRQFYPPHDLSGYGPPVGTAPRPRRPRSFVGSVTMFLAMIVGGIIVAIQSTSGSVNLTVVGGAVLVTIGAGLLVATWFGRGAALIAAGTLISIALVAGSTLTGMPRKFGSYRWEPTKMSEVARDYSVGIGEGTLNLSELPLPAGSRTVFEASVSVGQIRVILPATVPSIMTGVRLGATFSILMLVVAEYVGAKAGLGALVINSQYAFLIPKMYAAIVVLALLGLTTNAVLVRLQRRATRWKES